MIETQKIDTSYDAHFGEQIGKINLPCSSKQILFLCDKIIVLLFFWFYKSK